jgi:type I restriction enzyme R subunit
MVTDRNDLDRQLYQQFCAAKTILKQTPEQAESREQLCEVLAARYHFHHHPEVLAAGQLH